MNPQNYPSAKISASKKPDIIGNWEHQDYIHHNWLKNNRNRHWVGKSPYAPLYGTGPGYSAHLGSQGITSGAGTKPIEGGMREDGRLTSPQGVFHNINSHTDIEKLYNSKMTFRDNNGSLRNNYGVKDWDLHIKGPEYFTINPSDSGIVGRNWLNSYPGYYKPQVQNDDPFTSSKKLQSDKPLEAGEPDLSPDSNKGQHSTIPQYSKQGNNPYNVIKNAHPSDVLGGLVNLLNKVERDKMDQVLPEKNHHERHRKRHPDSTINHIKNIEKKMYKCDNDDYPYLRKSKYFPGQYCTKENIDFEKSLNNKSFCYINETVPPELVDYYKKMKINPCDNSEPVTKPESVREKTVNKIKTKIELTEDERKYYNSKIEEDKRRFRSDLNLDRNQVMVDNQRTPININMSCNSGGHGHKSGPYWDGSHWGGYGTPNLHDMCMFNPEGCYGKTLNYWYGDQNAGNNIWKRRRMWKNNLERHRAWDYYQYGPDNRYWVGQNNMSTLDNRSTSRNISGNISRNISRNINGNISENTIGMPFAKYLPYDKVSQDKYQDKARDFFYAN